MPRFKQICRTSPGKLQLHIPHLITRHPPILSAVRVTRAYAMASRRLALNLQHALRSKAAINAVKTRCSPLTRGLATPVSHGSKTESTTLSNGFTVCHTYQQPLGMQLTHLRRSLPSTPRGPRRRPSVYGSMPEAAQRLTRQTEPHTFWSTLLLRYGDSIMEMDGAGELMFGIREPRSAHNNNSSSR